MGVIKALFGIILLVGGLLFFISGYNSSAQCNTSLGQVATAISSTFGTGTLAQQCSNAQSTEVIGGVAGLIGLILLVSRGDKAANAPAHEKMLDSLSKQEHDAIKTLKVRYANGEITKKQYLEMKKDLE